MKKLIVLLLTLILLTGNLAGCVKEDSQPITDPETTVAVTAEPTAEPTEEPKAALVGENADIKYAKGFNIINYGDDIKLVTDGEGQKYFLVPSVMGEIPVIPKEATDAVIVRTPVQNAIFGSATQLGTLLAIATDDVLDSIGGVSTDQFTWFIDSIEERLADGRIAFIGGDGSTDPDYEMITALEPDIAFLFTGDYGQQDIVEKLSELNILSTIDNEYLENGYMSRLEWLRFLAAFYNLDEEAEAYMAEQETLVKAVKLEVADLDKPKVVWASIWKGIVYVTGADSYVAKQISDAGGDYMFADYGDTTAGITMEEFYSVAKDADILVYASSAMWMTNPTTEGIVELAPVLAEMKAVKDGNVYAFNDDYFTAAYKGARAVKDLAAIFHPGLYDDWSIESYVVLP